MLKSYEGAREIIEGWGGVLLIALFLLVGGTGEVKAEASYPVQTHRVCFTPEIVTEIFSQPTLEEADEVFTGYAETGSCLYFPIPIDADAVAVLNPVTGFLGSSHVFKLWPAGSRKGAAGYWAAPEKIIREIRAVLRGV